MCGTWDELTPDFLPDFLRRVCLAATRQGRPTPQPGEFANDGSVVPDIADVRKLSLGDGRQFLTKVPGHSLFFPLLLDLELPQAVAHAGLPGSEQIPPLRSRPFGGGYHGRGRCHILGSRGVGRDVAH